MEGKPFEAPGTCHFSEVFRGPIIRGMPDLGGAQSRKGLYGRYHTPVLILGPYCPADPIMQGVLVVEKKTRCGVYGSPQWEYHNVGPWDSGARPCHLQWRVLCLLKNSS